MLAHMRSKAEREVDEAESAVDDAMRRMEMEGTNINRALLELATEKGRDRWQNLDWQRLKQKQLDQYGIVLFDNGEPPHELDQQERQWNREFQEMETANAAASAGSGTTASAAATASAAVGAAAAASARPAMEIAVAPMQAPVPDAGATAQVAAAASAGTTSPAGASASAAMGAAAAASAGPAQAPNQTEAAIERVSAVPVQVCIRQLEEQAHAAAPAGSGKPFHSAKEAAAANTPINVEEHPPPPLALPLPRTLPPPPPFLTGQRLGGEPTAKKRASTAKPSLRDRKQRDGAAASARAAPHCAVPDRLPPFVLESRHDANHKLDVDWTLCPEDWGKELRRRKERNLLIKGNLQAGKSVCYRSSGWSLYPHVWENDQTTYEPVTSADQLHVNDIVFCEVQPGSRFYAHLVKEKRWEWTDYCETQGEWYFTISNAKGRENGWCRIEHIYGRLAECLH